MDENILKFILKIFIIVLLIFSLIVFINTIGINLNTEENPKKLITVITLEGLETIPETEVTFNKKKSFCDNHRGSSNILEESCGNLTRRNCISTSCCVFTSENKCVAGNQDGPIFNSDSKGKTKHLDYYYYQDTFYCPKCVNNK
jgi:hypothetical protein